MSKLQSVYFEGHLMLSVMLMCAYIAFMIIDKDELEEKAQSYALKYSNLITVISLMLYIFYKAIIGDIKFTAHTILAFINILCILYLMFSFLYMRGIIVSFKIKNIKFLDSICWLSTGLSIILIITGFLKVKFFELPSSFIRLDTVLMLINIIIITLILGLYPKKKLSREEYKKMKQMQINIQKYLL